MVPNLMSGVRSFSFWLLGLLLCGAPAAQAGGGLVLRDDVCVLQIGFYEAHFTAYQPQQRGNEEFCQTLPEVAETLFVLDYMHDSLKEVAVDFRIIRNVTQLGAFAKLKDVEALGDLQSHTVYYAPGSVEPDASFKTSHTFLSAGEYICVVSAGHPSKEVRYLAAFPIEVGGSGFSLGNGIAVGALAATGLLFLLVWMRRSANLRSKA